jgi:uncharacterized protein (TIGR00730 family)
MKKAVKAYNDPTFLNSKEAREVRILAEYLEPKLRLERLGVEDTIVFFGSARISDQNHPGEHYYEAARQLAFRLTQWSKTLEPADRRFVVCTGGGPGIMEAANRGASEAKGLSVGMAITLPREEQANRYVTRELAFHFHYFFMRKFWLLYTAKAVIVFPGGFGTLDEMFEVLTLVQTRKMTKTLPIVLFGKDYWNEIINFEALVKHGVINREDLGLFHRTDSVDDAYDWVVTRLTEHALGQPGPTL